MALVSPTTRLLQYRTFILTELSLEIETNPYVTNSKNTITHAQNRTPTLYEILVSADGLIILSPTGNSALRSEIDFCHVLLSLVAASVVKCVQHCPFLSLLARAWCRTTIQQIKLCLEMVRPASKGCLLPRHCYGSLSHYRYHFFSGAPCHTMCSGDEHCEHFALVEWLYPRRYSVFVEESVQASFVF